MMQTMIAIALTAQLSAQAAPPAAPAQSVDRLGTVTGSVVTDKGPDVTPRRTQLRDSASTVVMATGWTDKTGHFLFEKVAPGQYTVEILLNNEEHQLVAASPKLTVAAGESLTTLVRMPTPVVLTDRDLTNNKLKVGAMIAIAATALGLILEGIFRR